MNRRTSLALLAAMLLATSACDLMPGASPGPSLTPIPPVLTPPATQPTVQDRIDGYLAVAPRILEVRPGRKPRRIHL